MELIAEDSLGVSVTAGSITTASEVTSISGIGRGITAVVDSEGVSSVVWLVDSSIVQVFLLICQFPNQEKSLNSRLI